MIVEAAPLTKDQKADVKDFFSSIVKKTITGDGTSTHCVGPDKEAVKKVERFSVELKSKQGKDGNLVLSFKSKDKENKTIRKEKLRLFGDNNPYYIHELTDHSLVISSKLRKRPEFRKNAYINEEVIKINVVKKSLTIEVTRYVGGFFGVQTLRTFKL